MKKLAKILRLIWSHLRNAEHYQLFLEIMQIYTPQLAALLGMSEHQAQLQAYFDSESVLFIRSQKYKQTAALQELDHARDELFRGFKSGIIFYKNTGTDAQKAAANAINFLLASYRKAAGKSYVENSAQMGKFIIDVQAPEYAPHLVTLNLTATVEAMETANNNFIILFDARSEEELGRAEFENMLEARQQVDASFQLLADALPVLHYVETDPTKKQTIGDAIEAINALIHHQQTTLSRRGVKSSADSGSDDNGGDDDNGGGSDAPGGDETPGGGGNEPDPETPPSGGGDGGSGGPLDRGEITININE
jgi:hypothetical protein